MLHHNRPHPRIRQQLSQLTTLTVQNQTHLKHHPRHRQPLPTSPNTQTSHLTLQILLLPKRRHTRIHRHTPQTLHRHQITNQNSAPNPTSRNKQNTITKPQQSSPIINTLQLSPLFQTHNNTNIHPTNNSCNAQQPLLRKRRRSI